MARKKAAAPVADSTQTSPRLELLREMAQEAIQELGSLNVLGDPEALWHSRRFIRALSEKMAKEEGLLAQEEAERAHQAAERLIRDAEALRQATATPIAAPPPPPQVTLSEEEEILRMATAGVNVSPVSGVPDRAPEVIEDTAQPSAPVEDPAPSGGMVQLDDVEEIELSSAPTSFPLSQLRLPDPLESKLLAEWLHKEGFRVDTFPNSLDIIAAQLNTPKIALLRELLSIERFQEPFTSLGLKL